MRIAAIVCGLGASLLSVGMACADMGDQLAKILPDDGGEGDVFGRSCAMDGDLALVGAVQWTNEIQGAGAAYVFNLDSHLQVAKLTAVDGNPGDHFGFSVSLRGSFSLVGAMYGDGVNESSGAAYLFDASSGQQLMKFEADDGAGNDRFGGSVAIGGPPGHEVAIIGAHGDDDNGSWSGSAYLFDLSTGEQLFKLLPDDGAEFRTFGNAVAINETTVLIASYLDRAPAFDSGSVYLFDIATGQQLAKLTPDDGAAEDHFGNSVAMSETIAVVGAELNDDLGNKSGSAYIFDLQTGEQLFKLLPDDGAELDQFGFGVSVHGKTAIVSAVAREAAYLFDTTTGEQTMKLEATGGAPHDRFGWSVRIDGAPGQERAIVGATYDEDNGEFAGALYLFDVGNPCQADIDGDGAIGFTDLVALLGRWGACGNCSEDLNGDGQVDFGDLLVLLGTWGPC